MSVARCCRRGIVVAVGLVALACATAGGATAKSKPPVKLPPAIAEYVEMQPTASGPKVLAGGLTLPTSPAGSAAGSSAAPARTSSTGAPAAKKKPGVHTRSGGSTRTAGKQAAAPRLVQPRARSAMAAAVGGGGDAGWYLVAAAAGSLVLVVLLRLGFRRRS